MVLWFCAIGRDPDFGSKSALLKWLKKNIYIIIGLAFFFFLGGGGFWVNRLVPKDKHFCLVKPACAQWGSQQGEGLWLQLLALVTGDSGNVTQDRYKKKIIYIYIYFISIFLSSYFQHLCHYQHTSRFSLYPICGIFLPT